MTLSVLIRKCMTEAQKKGQVISIAFNSYKNTRSTWIEDVDYEVTIIIEIEDRLLLG